MRHKWALIKILYLLWPSVNLSLILWPSSFVYRLEDASRLRENGHCPLMPEEAVLMLVALGFNRGTHLYLAGAHMYGGQSRMSALTNLYPYLATKEDLLTPAELAPFINRSSQVCFLQTLLIYCYPMCMSLGKNKLLKHFVGAISLHQSTPSFSFMLSACSTFNEAGRTIQQPELTAWRSLWVSRIQLEK
jgi:hypothetical protein